ncbi:MAG: hypothetical protein QOI21_4356 [Actinomycetota bacterium]|jgi:uncharacterized membrane protein|nr:hypothetical protein [Actinomycetota bacterium]
MQKPKLTPLQFRNLLTAALMAAAFVWSLTMGVWWLSLILALGCALSVTSAILNRPRTTP